MALRTNTAPTIPPTVQAKIDNVRASSIGSNSYGRIQTRRSETLGKHSAHSLMLTKTSLTVVEALAAF
jgi:hypothetical protein